METHEPETAFKFRGYPSKRGNSLSFLEDDDEDRSDARVPGNAAASESLYDNPSDVCRMLDKEEVASADTSVTEIESLPDLDASTSQAPHRSHDDDDIGGCFGVRDAALSSCVWVGSSLLSRMLFQIYKEMGDESKTNTR
jgi:hypothetical protein